MSQQAATAKFLVNARQLQTFLDRLSLWCTINGLHLNTAKCLSLYIGRGNACIPYHINGQAIASETSVRDLGLLVSPSLLWDDHVQHITAKARSRMFLLLKALRSRDIHFMQRMFNVYVCPLLEFASPVFNSFRAKNIHDIESVQRRFTHLIFQRSTTPTSLPYSERLAALKCKTLFNRRCATDLKTLHAIIHGRLNANLSSQFEITPSHIRGMERARLLVSTQSRLQVRSNYFLFRCEKLFNVLPYDVRKLIYSPLFITAIETFDFSDALAQL
jgi:hypothetical protein